MTIQLYHDDCFNVFPALDAKSIDLVLCDMPYGITACKWDAVLDLEKMWKELKRIAKDNTAIVLFCRQPFTSVLVCSNLKMFKYTGIWQKDNASNFVAAKYQPLDNIEDFAIFSLGGTNHGCTTPMTYNPQGLVEINKIRGVNLTVGGKLEDETNRSRLRGKGPYIQKYTNYPYKTVKIGIERHYQHPTQKPVALMEYLIKTYSNEGDTVLDFCMGSGTTGVACKNLNRSFIGVEKELEYYDIAVKRIEVTI